MLADFPCRASAVTRLFRVCIRDSCLWPLLDKCAQGSRPSAGGRTWRVLHAPERLRLVTCKAYPRRRRAPHWMRCSCHRTRGPARTGGRGRCCASDCGPAAAAPAPGGCAADHRDPASQIVVSLWRCAESNCNFVNCIARTTAPSESFFLRTWRQMACKQGAGRAHHIVSW